MLSVGNGTIATAVMEATYFSVHLKLLRWVGVSIEKESILYNIYFATVMVSGFMYCMVLLGDVVLHLNDVDIIVDSLYHSIGSITVLVKAVIVNRNGGALKKVFVELKAVVLKSDGEDTYEGWIRSCTIHSNRQIVGLLIVAVVSLGQLLITTTIKRFKISDADLWTLTLPFGRSSILNPISSPNFEITLIFQTIACSQSSFVYLITSLLTASAFAHLSVKLKILSSNFRKILDFEEILIYNEQAELRLEKLKENCIAHQTLLKVANDLERVISPMIFADIFGFLFILACIMVHVTMHVTWERIFTDISCAGGGLFVIYLVCYWGNEVYLESQLISDACYQIEFHRCNSQFTKHLCIVMVRCQKPIKFSAGKFSDITMVSYVAMIKGAFSFFNVYRSTMLSKTQ